MYSFLSTALYLFFTISRSQMNHNFLLKFFSEMINYFIITLFLLGKRALCIDPYFLACNPSSCGDGQNISFPFYIQHKQEPFCGYPGFQLSCNSNGKPILQLSGNDYIIHEIFYNNQSLLVSNAALLLDINTTTCLPPIQNTSLADERFTLSPNQTDLLLYNCNQTLVASNSILLSYKVNCSSENQTTDSTTLALFKDSPELDYVSKECNSNPVVAPVNMDDKADITNGIKGLLQRGFLLNWVASDCGICEASGGKCGFNNTMYHFRCFCPDRPQAWRCISAAGNNRLRLILSLGVAVTGIGVVMIVVYCFRRKISSNVLCWNKENQDCKSIEVFFKNYGPIASKRYSYSEVKKMTESFKDKLGQGGFGGVFKGKLPDGRLVAVKILKELKSNGEEFINEVASISRTSHFNVVTLLGFCFEGSKGALVYEFMSNGSLDKYIHVKNSSGNTNQLGWQMLYQIALGIARGLEYLHRGCNTRILHFDIKPHNILLDENFCPKISDFGLAKICLKRESIVSMLGARGTIGYIAPEVFCRKFGGVSHKSDVYSYGMLVLEMVGARNKNVCVSMDRTSEIYFPDWICKRLELGEDLELYGISNDEENQIARKMVVVSLWCIQTSPSDRPSMSRAVEMLQGSLESLSIPPRPCLSSPPRTPLRSEDSSLATTVTMSM